MQVKHGHGVPVLRNGGVMGNNMDRRMESYFKGFKNEMSSKKPIALDDVISFTAMTYIDNWKTSYDYTKCVPKEFKSVDIDEKLSSNIDFFININYINKLFRYLLYGESNKLIKEWVIKEVDEWEIMGGNCIYLSVLLYSLFKHDKIGCHSCVKYVQGFFRHEIRKDYPSFYPWSGQHNGLHAWLTVNGAIIDIAIMQQYPFFDFKNNPFILGNIPEGLIYMGYEESEKTVMEYVKDILDFSKKHYDLWICEHRLIALNLLYESIKTP